MLDKNLPLILTGILFFWTLALTIFTAKLSKHYQSLTKDVSKKDLISSLNNLITKSEAASGQIAVLKKIIETEIGENKLHLQKIGFRRFNPFTDTGGDQSFILSLLDENGTGIVISSLHSRENTRLYAKKVTNGEGVEQVLSKEELQVVKDSLK